ncbi:acetate/propionate family kinase [Kiritimatiella glycovorans]|uniref:Acetate kinase n=1 Tax=Kiritimatiella glycovorans TaxID=1307763 RepID=A0A0G3EE05_9BACT|nr:acetate kinase [Kiritimatiella glycovorans]AKJ64691.1 Acetate kinase [Kiritimatiella glycovorans]
MKILVINSGSSSIKYQLFEVTDGNDEYEVLARGQADRIGITGSTLEQKRSDGAKLHRYGEIKDHKQAINGILEMLQDSEKGVLQSLDDLWGVGHRVVHGGEDFTRSVRINKAVVKAIRKNADLAPLHNPPNLMGIQAVYEILPDIPQVAVFDTAIHQTMPRKAYMYGLPREQYKNYRIRRYGFHGTSHGYVAGQAAEALGRPLRDLKIITCHLGNGGSITAFEDGKSIDTSMGFTPLAGIVMGTRSGDLDPYIPLHMMENEGLSVSQVSAIMNKQGGLLGICGRRDMRDIRSAVVEGDREAAEAVEMYVYSIQKYIGAYAAAMNGVDAIVFTAGVGENEHHIRASVLENFGFLGLKVDVEANRNHETVITTEDSAVAGLVIHTDEELVIARDTYRLISEVESEKV